VLILNLQTDVPSLSERILMYFCLQGPGKRSNRPSKVLELDLSGFPTNQELGNSSEYGANSRLSGESGESSGGQISECGLNTIISDK